MRELTLLERDQLAGANVSEEELAAYWDKFPDVNFDAALGSVIMEKQKAQDSTT